MATKKLRPCPFCGGPAKLYWPEYRMYGWVECADPECNHLQRGSHQTKRDAVAAWNRRPVHKLHEESEP